MSKQPKSKAGAETEEVPECPDCGKPLPLCICESITPIEKNKVSLLILQHPQEQDRTLGTARLTALHFGDAVLKIGLSWPSLSKALGRPVEDPHASFRKAVSGLRDLMTGQAPATRHMLERRKALSQRPGDGRG